MPRLAERRRTPRPSGTEPLANLNARGIGAVSDLPIDLPPQQKRKRRHIRKRAVRRPPQVPRQPALFKVPDVQRCGFCGTTVTVLEDVASCPDCGSIVARSEDRQTDD
jgi:hypothetical protein